MSEPKRVECLNTLEKLCEIYKDNDYMLQRIYNHVHVYLPNTLETEAKNHEKRQNLNTYLSEEQQIFMQVFLSKNNYYYLSTNNFYYEYNGTDYLIVKEDEILHKILSTISKEKVLLQWKHKTKSAIIKQIKERNLFSSIPETDTIQNVLNTIYPSMFATKNAAKYFLTVIGDNILKKNTELTFIVNIKMRQLLDELEKVSAYSIGNNNISHKFVVKYHDTHVFNNCRLIKINNSYSNNYWRETLKRIGLNLLCVAAHYSHRYNNSDNFLNVRADDELVGYVKTLKNMSEQGLVKKFVDEYIEKTSMDFKIEWKNMHFIWKQFLSSNDLPIVIFSNSFKSMLKKFIQYDEETDSFIGITSKYLPVYKEFIEFWETTITSSTNNAEFENELEIDEIGYLFKQWSKNKNVLTEENIIRVLKHFFSCEIIDNKYVLNVVSNIWDKFNDIKLSIRSIKSSYIGGFEKNVFLISFDDLYKHYNKYCDKVNIKQIVSKRYFEKYLYYQYANANFIVYERFIKLEEWLYEKEC